MRKFDPDEPELMDRPQPVSLELEQDLLNLINLNRGFGSHRLIRKWLKPWWKGKHDLHILDLCTGGGDIPRLLVAEARKDGVNLTIDALDYQASTMAIAQKWSVDFPQITFESVDVLKREVPGAPTHDVVLCSLALHHFSEEDAVRVLRFMHSSARQLCMITDLERGWWTTIGVWLLTAILFRDPMTVHDGRVSAQRAFNKKEFRHIAELAGWRNFQHKTYFWYGRQVLWLEKVK